MSTGHGEFVSACLEQGVILQDNADESMSLANPDLPSIVASTLIGLRLSAEEPLANRLIDLSCFTDAVSIGHAKIINTSISPDLDWPLRFDEAGHSLPACKNTESYFGKWLNALGNGKVAAGRIIVDPQGRPLILQKSKKYKDHFGIYGLPSGLLLQDVVIAEVAEGRKGVQIPTGSIVSARLSPPAYNRTIANYGETSVVQMHEVTGLSFLRMSGFSLTNAEWYRYFDSDDSVVPSNAMTIEYATEVGAAVLAAHGV